MNQYRILKVANEGPVSLSAALNEVAPLAMCADLKNDNGMLHLEGSKYYFQPVEMFTCCLCNAEKQQSEKGEDMENGDSTCKDCLADLPF